MAIAALLGADEMGFSTAPLIATGCIMMRACHLNTCPVGIATQDPELRKRFQGQPEHVVNFFFFVAEEVREIMASLGVRTFDDLIGRVDLLEADDAIEHWKARGIDLTHAAASPPDAARGRAAPPRRARRRAVLDDALDCDLVEEARPRIERRGRPGRDRQADPQRQPLRRRHALARRSPSCAAPRACREDSIEVDFRGSAGQSFGGWLAPGVSFTLHGDANDYTGKGLSGGVLAVAAARGRRRSSPRRTQLIGNTVLYGATGGQAFFRGLAGERFAVRNSGASAVVEGVGDHGCEYMTGGRVVVLGPTGRNFAAGMSGGLAYVLDEDGAFRRRVQPDDARPARGARRRRRARAARAGRRAPASAPGPPVGQRVLDDWDAARRSS